MTVRTASRSMHDGLSSTRAAVHRVRATEPSLSYPSPQSTAVARHVGSARRVIVSLVGISACHGQRKRCRLRFDADELRRDGCHRKPPHAQLYAHWAPLTSTLVPRSLSEVRWRRQGSGSTSHGPRSAHCRADALCADLFKVLPDLHRRDQMTAERRPARARSSRATGPRAAWLRSNRCRSDAPEGCLRSEPGHSRGSVDSPYTTCGFPYTTIWKALTSLNNFVQLLCAVTRRKGLCLGAASIDNQ